MSFKESVRATVQIKNAYCLGLQAMGSNASKIHFANTYSIEGSVDLDKATKKYYPKENRWDYVVGYKEKVYFFEIHPAYSSEVKTIKSKFNWLNSWLKNKAPKLNEIPSKFYWLYTLKFAIPKNTKQYRAAAEMGLIPIKEFRG